MIFNALFPNLNRWLVTIYRDNLATVSKHSTFSPDFDHFRRQFVRAGKLPVCRSKFLAGRRSDDLSSTKSCGKMVAELLGDLLPAPNVSSHRDNFVLPRQNDVLCLDHMGFLATAQCA